MSEDTPMPEVVPPQPPDLDVEGVAEYAPAATSPADDHPADDHPADDHVDGEPVYEERFAPTALTDASQAPAEIPVEEDEEHKKHWYVVKVQSNREDSIKEALERKMRKDKLEEFIGCIVIPVEKYVEYKVDKNGKRVAKNKERKLYPGYLMVQVAYNDRVVYMFRETTGVGDFVGAHPGDLKKAPTPMSETEVMRMLGPMQQPAGDPGKPGEAATPPVAPKPKWMHENDRVRVVDGTFNGSEGRIKQLMEANSKVQVELTIFGRPVTIDLEYYQVEQL